MRLTYVQKLCVRKKVAEISEGLFGGLVMKHDKHLLVCVLKCKILSCFFLSFKVSICFLCTRRLVNKLMKSQRFSSLADSLRVPFYKRQSQLQALDETAVRNLKSSLDRKMENINRKGQCFFFFNNRKQFLCR